MTPNLQFVDKGKVIAEGNTITFAYKGGRKVCGVVKWITTNGIGLTLKTDYIGKNVEWFVGEEKYFNIKECKNLKISQP